ncbi:MAG: DMT family transporter [Proteobacteria bacterium]|nr:DMT family transporter [Pseudomonadota bacterium]
MTASTPRTVAAIVLLALVWGCNWPILKLGVAEIPPLTFRALTLPLAALGMLALSRAWGATLTIPRAYRGKLLVLAAFNITGWNAFVLFGVRELESGRSAILAYTMPIWATLIAWLTLHEPLSRRKLAGFALGFGGLAVLLVDELSLLRNALHGTLMILAAAFLWALGTVLMRRWRTDLPQTTLSGWMMLVGWVPIALAVPLFDAHPFARLSGLSGAAWFSLAYNVVLAGTIANGIWFMLARTLPVAVSSLSSLPIPIVGVFSGMLVLGERPGTPEWIALALVVGALAAVLMPTRLRAPPAKT